MKSFFIKHCMVKLIPQIEKKIEKVLRKLNLTPFESPANFIQRTEGKKHRYSTLCENEKGEKFIFYARLHNSPFEKKRMKNEVKMANALRKKNYPFFPKYIEAKTEKDFEWIVREYFQENTLESKKEIEKLSRPLNEKEIYQICKVLLAFQKIKLSEFPFLKPRELKKFLILPKEIKERKIFGKEEYLTEKLIRENRKFLIKENRFFTHGDFQIGNIIFEKGKIKVIDLESAMISNFAYDICFLWARLWREKVRRKILEKFYSLLPKGKRKKFELLFRINALFIGFHSFVANVKEYSEKMKIKRKDFFWKLMKKALFSFEDLKKI